jgi:dihydroxyacetone kinase-like protein
VPFDLVDVHLVAAWLREAAAVVRAEQWRLSTLDAAIGDGDHGANMVRGVDAVERVLDGLDAEARPGAVLTEAGAAFHRHAGGATGPLWGTALHRAGRRFGDAATGDAATLAAALDAACAGVVTLGAAEPGDKTMLDAMLPAAGAFGAAARERHPIDFGATAAARAAEDGARATVPMLARRGRAAFLGERSIGHQDPGATSVALVIRALATTLRHAAPAPQP